MVDKKQIGLYIVATPLGNLNDLSPRAVDVLAGVDTILCEDTRVSQKLLNHYNISKPLLSFHAHKEYQQIDRCLAYIHDGHRLALISDAGMPTISDPGHLLIAKAHSEQIPVVVIPGPVALTMALAGSGFSGDRFVFEGFLPARGAQRRARLKVLAHELQEPRTIVFYEAPHRLLAMLEDLQAIYGPQHPICLAKELSKIHEKIIRAPVADILAWLRAKPERQKGEFTVVMASQPPTAQETIQISQHDLLQTLQKYLPARQAAQATAELSHDSANRLYQQAVKNKQDD